MRSPMVSTRLGWVSALVMGVAIGSLPVSTLRAQAAPDDTPAAAPAKKKERKGGTLSEATYRQLERIQTMMGKNENAPALEKAKALLERVGNDYEKSVVLQTIAFIHLGLNQYKPALQAFEQLRELDALPQQQYEQMLYNLGQLYFQDGQTDKAIARMEEYFAETTSEPTPDAHILLAAAYADKQQFRKALPQVDKALAKTDKPKESWLQLKLALHYELKEYPQCAEVLLKLISLAPVKEDYWKQLSSILFELKRDQESLAVFALAERQGFLDTDTEVRNLANLYMLLDTPYKAAQVLQVGLDRNLLKADEKTLTQLGDAWTMAREYDKAEAALKLAARQSSDGEIFYRLGMLYVEDERWKDAYDMLEQARGKKLKNPGQAAYLQGVAAFNLGQRQRAVALLRSAQQHDASRNVAGQWLNHIAQMEEAEVAAAAVPEAPAVPDAPAAPPAAPATPPAPKAP